MRSIKNILFLHFLAFSLTVAEAATVFFKDGSRINGTIVSATAREVQLHTEDGLLKIDTNRIARIDYAEMGEPPAPPPASRETSWDEDRGMAGEVGAARQEFSIDFGLAAPLSRIDGASAGGGSTDNGDPGPLLGAQYLYELTPRWGAGFAVQYLNRSRSNSTGFVPFADASIGGNSLLLMGVAKYSLVKRGNTRPYVLAGLGANRTSTIIDATPLPGFAWSDTNTEETRRLIDDSRWGLASTVRLGIDFRAMDPGFFAFELGWTGFNNGSYDASPSGRDLGLNEVSGDISVFTVAGRWGWRF